MPDGKICYLEIPTTDIARSVNFYQTVFGWKTRTRGDGAVALLLLSLVGANNIVCACAKFVSITEELPTKDSSMIITPIVAAVEQEIDSGINRCNDSILFSVNVIIIYYYDNGIYNHIIKYSVSKT